MDSEAKLRPFYLAKILYERTDDDHSLTTAQLIKILEDDYHIHTHRTTIMSDIELLQSLGMDIQLTKSSQNKYNVLGRYFEDIELKLMIDAVESSRFITKKQSEVLVGKISALAGKNAAEKMKRNISVERRIKGGNEKLLVIADAINRAITQKKQISFRYFDFDEKKERVLRNEGQKYLFSPYRLVWNGEFYYAVGWHDKYGTVTSFRVDRIASVPDILEELPAVPIPKGFDLDHYLNTMYHMFSTDRVIVELICQNEVMDAVIDRFGEDVETHILDENHFTVKTEVAANKLFFMWIFGFEGKVSIRGPERVLEEYRQMLRNAVKGNKDQPC